MLVSSSLAKARTELIRSAVVTSDQLKKAIHIYMERRTKAKSFEPNLQRALDE